MTATNTAPALSTIHTTNTRRHRVVATDTENGVPVGVCQVCLEWGELRALLDLLPNSHGCPGYPTE